MKMWDVRTGEQLLSRPDAPGGFARDGRRYAGGTPGRVSFNDLLLPDGLHHLTGHGGFIEQLAWSGDNRHLASLDSGFEVRVWDVEERVAMHAVSEKPGGVFATNAAVALTDDGGQVAYVNGGDSTALIRDVKTGTKLGEWKLCPGYERLACVDGKFLLVREQDEENGGMGRSSVVWDLAVGREPKKLRVLRRARAGEKGFYACGLSADGCKYWWWGPRFIEGQHRIEVHDVQTGDMVSYPAPKEEGTNGFPCLSDDGRYLWVGAVGTHLQFDLVAGGPPQRIPITPVALSLGPRWYAALHWPGEGREAPVISVRRWEDEGGWLEFGNQDLRAPRATRFSKDGRYLAWGSESGIITVADLLTLRKEVDTFMAEVLGN
jgi:hypothetical protein